MMLEGNSAELVPCIPDVRCSVVCEYRILIVDCGLWTVAVTNKCSFENGTEETYISEFLVMKHFL